MQNAKNLPGLNPAILTWARETAGLSLEEVASSLKKDVGKIKEWEEGFSSPTFVQLETLAYKLYKRPVALFFFPKPPREPDPSQSFRTLPEFEIIGLESEVRLKVRDALAKQEILRELTGNKNPIHNPIFRSIQLSPEDSVESAAMRVREFLEIPVETQRSFRRMDHALTEWRDSVEAAGVFVFKGPFGVDGVSGFCLFDTEFPVIYINNSTSKSRQIFTLFHELAHLLLGVGGITKVDDRFIGSLTGVPRQVEIFCNAFAAEFLLPTKITTPHLLADDLTEERVAELAKEFSVSREVILRRALEMELVSQSDYEYMREKWIEEYHRAKSNRKPGGSYYRNQAKYLGKAYMSLAFTRLYEGRIRRSQLADILSVKSKNIPRLEDVFLQQVG